MNFSFVQRKFGFAQPARHYSMGMLAKEPAIFKPDYVFHTVANNFFTEYNGAILPTKSFTNPNYVIKQHPNVQAPLGSGMAQSCVLDEPEPRRKGKARRRRWRKEAKHKKTDDAKKDDKTLAKIDLEFGREDDISNSNVVMPKVTIICNKVTENTPSCKLTNFLVDQSSKALQLICGQTDKHIKCPEAQKVFQNKQAPQTTVEPMVSIKMSHPIQINYTPKLSSSESSEYSISPLSPAHRFRLVSDCDSEDSFIVFQDDKHISEEDSDSDFEIEFNNKTDKKKVTFSDAPVVHPLVVWCYAYQSARVGEWEQLARDRMRFENRIRRTEPVISKILSEEHRRRVFDERFRE